jgi:hypothetical protein
MDIDLTAIKAALADTSDTELDALIAATHYVPQIAPGMLARMEHAADWEQHRRRDFDFLLHPPEAAIPPEEDAVSIDTGLATRAMFGEGRPPYLRSSRHWWICSPTAGTSTRSAIWPSRITRARWLYG